MIELLLIPLGVLCGFALGMLPGMHINNILPFLAFLPFSDDGFYFFIISASISFVFSSFFQSVLVGAPNEETAISVLPGHRLIQKGQGHLALLLLIYGGLVALLVSAALLPLFIFILPYIETSLKFFVPFVLISAVLYILITDKNTALVIVFLSSMLGFLTINYNLLLPLLSGFFALSTLLVSLETRNIPVQKIGSIQNEKVVWPAAMACILSMFLNLFPAMSSSIVATICSAVKKMGEKTFLALIGSTNVSYMAFSFFLFSLVGKTRSGSAAFLAQVSTENVFFIAGILLVAGILSAVLAILFLKRIMKIYQKINYAKLTAFSILFLISVNFIFTGFFGLLVLFASTGIGLLCNFLGCRRINCMAALIVPTVWVLL